MLSRAEAKIKDTSYFREKRLWNFENMIKLMLINMRYLLVLSSMGILALMIGPGASPYGRHQDQSSVSCEDIDHGECCATK